MRPRNKNARHLRVANKWCGIGHPPPRKDRNPVPRRGDALVRRVKWRGKSTCDERLTVVAVHSEFCRKHDRNETSVTIYNDRTRREERMYWGRWQTLGYAIVRGVSRRGNVRL